MVPALGTGVPTRDFGAKARGGHSLVEPGTAWNRLQPSCSMLGSSGARSRTKRSMA
jgi:hypothetical protein